MIEIERRDELAIVRMKRGKGNAMNIEFLDALSAAFQAVEQSDARAAVLTGDGKIFCAGVDLPAVVDGGEEYLSAFLPALVRCFEGVVKFEKPLVAAVDGHAIAGGCLLALASDFRIAVPHAKLGLTELLVGVPFPAWPLEVAREFVPPQHLAELIFTGRLYSNADAIARGMVDEIAPGEDLLARACEAARQMAAIPSAAFAQTKRQLRAPLIARATAHATQHDAGTFRIWHSDTTRQAIADFVEKTIKRGR